ncbi:vomeronasal type-2 receptor 26-like [Protopterus annectens]|uniref:vomeronasal type-2 receptor 26-like n=1 Tax=Protopterus annectens TaxID=7888 RepID=UPI001CF9B98B|nr:vomeronasal type-2 receptor 26-like [Protopterus annectens]
MDNDFCKFIPDFNELSVPLQELTCKIVAWSWFEQHQTEFDNPKQQIANPSRLRYYGVHKPVVLSCNTLKFGLGEVILQEDRLAACVSRTLSQNETQYTQIEKEILLLHYVKNVHFQDSSGETVFFDENGDTPAKYDLLNWQVPHSVCSESCPPGTRKVTRRGQPICCFDCITCAAGEIANQSDLSNCFRCPKDQWPNYRKDACIQKDVDFLSYEDTLGSALSASTTFCSLMTASVLCIFIKYRGTPIVKANNSKLSYIILISLFLCFLCPLIFIGRPKTITCQLRQIGFGIIFSFCISGILAKTITVVIAFKATDPDSNLRKYLGQSTPYYIVLVGTMLQALICMIWWITSPPFSYMNMKLEEKSIVECQEGSVVMFYCMLGYMGLLASVSFIVAFLARVLPDRFNEAKFISFSMIVFVNVWLSFIPAYLSTMGKYMVAVEIFAIIASGAGIIICMFFPKCCIILLRPTSNTKVHLTGVINSSKIYRDSHNNIQLYQQD